MKKYLKEKYHWIKKRENLRKIFLAIILILCIFEFIFIKNEKKEVFNKFQNYPKSKNDFKKIRENKPITNTNQIESWMTFSYINFIFKLPNNYLKNNLNINDTKYPNTSIQRYIKINNLNTGEFIFKLKSLIDSYSNPNTNNK